MEPLSKNSTTLFYLLFKKIKIYLIIIINNIIFIIIVFFLSFFFYLYFSKINELEKNENKAGPAAASSGQEKAPSSSQPLEAQTYDSDGGKTFLPIPNDQVHDFFLEARGKFEFI